MPPVSPRVTRALATAALLGAPVASAQTIVGRVMEQDARTPIRAVDVRLTNDSGAVVARASTDSTGLFYAMLGAPAHVRITFELAGIAFETDTLTLGANDYLEREFTLASVRSYTEGEVDIPVRPAPGTNRIVYPMALLQAGIGGEVLASFDVDTTGHVAMESFRVLRSTDVLFIKAVRDGLSRMSFIPAQKDGHPVRQRCQQPFTFAIGSSKEIGSFDLPRTPRYPGGAP